jgi:glycosyltransferase involved in cell wall biosynthesis
VTPRLPRARCQAAPGPGPDDGPPGAILFLHSGDDGFGSDRVLVAMVDVAKGMGAAVRVLLPDDVADGWLSAQLRERRVEVRKLPLAPARRRYLRATAVASLGRDLVRARRMVRAEVRAWRPDVVHVNTTALPVAAMLGRLPAARLVWHVHELVVSPPPVAWLLRALPMWAADEVVAISDAVAANLRRAPWARARLRRIHNGIAARPERATGDAGGRAAGDAVVSVFAGRLSRWKGYDLFTEAAAIVAPEFPHARFVIAGTPPEGEEWRSPQLADRLAQLGVADRTDVVGMCADVPALLDRTDIAVIPSRWPEPFGLVTVEAMRAGCAVIASGHGASPEILTDGVDGVLVPPGDVTALAEAWRRLLAEPGTRERLGAAARRRVAEAFSDRQFAAEIAALWQGDPPRHPAR